MSNEWTDTDRARINGLLKDFWSIGGTLADEYVEALQRFWPRTVEKAIRDTWRNAEKSFKPMPAALVSACQAEISKARAAKGDDDDRRRARALELLDRMSRPQVAAIFEARNGQVFGIGPASLVVLEGDQAGYSTAPYVACPTRRLEEIVDGAKMDAQGRSLVEDEEIWRPKPLGDLVDKFKNRPGCEWLKKALTAPGSTESHAK